MSKLVLKVYDIKIIKKITTEYKANEFNEFIV